MRLRLKPSDEKLEEGGGGGIDIGGGNMYIFSRNIHKKSKQAHFQLQLQERLRFRLELLVHVCVKNGIDG